MAYLDNSNNKSKSNFSKFNFSLQSAINLLLILSVIYCFYRYNFKDTEELDENKKLVNDCPYKRWQGNSPTHVGSCWCDKRDSRPCSCSHSLAWEAIIEYTISNKTKILLVQRSDPPIGYYAITGGFVEVGESVEETVIREVKEETNMTITHKNIEQFKMFSVPTRDKRRHTISMVFRCIIDDKIIKDLHSGDDAKSIIIANLNEVLLLKLACDHKNVLTHYLKRFHPYIFYTK